MRDQLHAPAALFPGKDSVPIVQEAGWAPGPVWTGAENLAPTGIRSPDRPARSQSLYRLSYRAHIECNTRKEIKGEFIWKQGFGGRGGLWELKEGWVKKGAEEIIWGNRKGK